MEELKVFNNEELGEVRILDIDGEPWFVGKDVAEALGYERPVKAVNDRVDSEDRDVVPIQDSIGRMQNTPIINEPGLYSLILSSKLPNAKKFKKWVTTEVLPSIRKTGSYSTSDKPENEKQIEDKQVEDKVSDEVLKKALKEEAEGKRYLDTIEGRLKYLEHLVFDMRYGEPGCYTRKLTERNKSGLKRRHGYTGNSWMERNKGKILKATVDYELKADDICSTIIRRCSEKYRLEDAVEIYCQEVWKYPEDTMDLIDYFPELAAIADKFLYSIR